MSERHAPSRRASTPSRRPKQQRKPAPASRTSHLTTLAALYDEAAQTSALANLLGRTSWLGAAFIVGAGGAFLAAHGSVRDLPLIVPSLVWLVFALAGAAALLRLYRHAIRSPFERAALTAFESDLRAVLLYAGCAWGAGAFFLGIDANLLVVLGYSTGMAIATEVILRRPQVAMYFALPATVLPAIAVAFGPEGIAGACLIVAAAGCVIAGAEVVERLFAHRMRPVLLTVS